MVLPVLFILIVLFGHGENRFRSAFLIFLYTLAGSLPMLLSILTIYSYLDSTDYQLISFNEISLESQKWLWVSIPFSKENLPNRDLNKNYSPMLQHPVLARHNCGKYYHNFATPLFRSFTVPFFHHMAPQLQCNTASIRQQRRNLSTGKFIKLNRMKWLPENKECKSLVIYGTNLSSTVNYVYLNKIIREMVKIPNNLNSIILGIILSDGHLRKKNSGYTYLSFKQTIKRFELTWVLFLKFSHFCQGYPRLDYTNVNNKNFTSIVFVTRVYPCFTEWHDMFYVNNKKIVPLELYNMLDYEALAYWIMGDGTKSGNGMVLQTQSFTVKDCVFIIGVLIHKFDLDCSLYMQRNQPTIYINTKSMKKIKNKLISYFPISMQYKL
jgi:hypothetical protein